MADSWTEYRLDTKWTVPSKATAVILDLSIKGVGNYVRVANVDGATAPNYYQLSAQHATILNHRQVTLPLLNEDKPVIYYQSSGDATIKVIGWHTAPQKGIQ
jgi:hypothetical protein